MTLAVASIIITSVICSGILYLVIWHFRRRRLYKEASKFEGPPCLPFIGNAHLFIGNGEQILTKLNELTSSYPSPLRVWLGPMLVCGITEPEQIEKICLSPKTLEKGKVFADFSSPWLGDGILTGPASIWKVHRKLIQPTFNTKILNSFVEVFSTQSKIFVDRIEKNLDGPEFEIFYLIGSCTLDMICAKIDTRFSWITRLIYTMNLTMVSQVIIGALCAGILYIMIWHFRRRRLYEFASKFKGPPALPFIGNAHLFLGNGEQILTKLNELTSSYSSPLRVWLGPMLVFCITEPEQIEKICLSPKTLEKGKVFVDCTSPWLGDGILTGPASIWKVHRKLIQPTFNTKILNSFVEVFSAQSKIFVDRIEKNLDGPEFEVFYLVASCTLDMICETAMGVKIEAQTSKNCYYEEAAQTVIAGFCKRIFSVWLHPDFTFRLSELGRVQRKWIKYLHEFTENIIKEKKSQLLERNSEPDVADDVDDSNPRRRKAFLDYLMTLSDSNAALSDKELREETDTMVVAGNDATVVASTNLLSMLASHPDIQEKVYQELYEIYGDDDIEVRPVIPRDLSRMKYLERVIKETLRLFPVIPFIVREVTDDLDIGDHTLPRGSTAAIGILAVHRSERYWPDPLKFDPDRFSPKKVAKRHPYAFLPFSGGPRNCIGLNYAMMSMKTLAATILRRYILIKDDIVPMKDIRLKMEIALAPVDPIKIRIERRNRK